MTITSIKQSVGGNEVYINTADSGSFTVSLADSKRIGLYGINDEDFPFEFHEDEQLEFLSQKLKAIKYCTYLLNFSDKSEFILKKKLREKEYSAEVSLAALETLKQNGIICDSSLCLRKLRSISKEKLYGPYRIKSELMTKGFSVADINDAFENAEIDFDLTLSELCQKLLTTSKVDLSDKAAADKFKAKLVRLGYGFESINRVLRDFSNDNL